MGINYGVRASTERRDARYRSASSMFCSMNPRRVNFRRVKEINTFFPTSKIHGWSNCDVCIVALEECSLIDCCTSLKLGSSDEQLRSYFSFDRLRFDIGIRRSSIISEINKTSVYRV